MGEGGIESKGREKEGEEKRRRKVGGGSEYVWRQY